MLSWDHTRSTIVRIDGRDGFTNTGSSEPSTCSEAPSHPAVIFRMAGTAASAESNGAVFLSLFTTSMDTTVSTHGPQLSLLTKKVLSKESAVFSGKVLILATLQHVLMIASKLLCPSSAWQYTKPCVLLNTNTKLARQRIYILYNFMCLVFISL